MTAKKKKSGDTPDIGHTLRDHAEEQLARSPKNCPDLKGQSQEELVHELQVHQIELETQAEALRKAHRELEESRDKFLDLYEFAPTGYLTLNDTALIEEVNLTGATLLGVDRKKLLNARFRKFIAEKDSEPWVRYFMNVLAQERKQSCTLMIQQGDGSTFLARLESIRITDKSDGTPRVHVAISDISDIRRVEDALRESEVRFRSLFQNMDSLFSLYEVVLDKNGIPTDYRFIELNSSYEKFIGMKSSELIGRTLLEVFPLTESYWTDKFKEVYSTGIPSHFENYSKELDTYIELSIYSPQKGQIALISSDITDRKRAEETLRLANERFRRYVDANIVGVILASPYGGIIDANDYYLHMIGYTREEFEKGMVNWRSVTPPEWLYADEHALEELRERGRCTPYEKEYIRRDGSRVPVILSDAMLPGSEEQIVAFVLDITERKRAEEALQRVNQKLNVLSQLTRKDLTNQTFVLSSYLELAKNQLTGQEHIIETLEKGVRSVRLIHDTIEYSKDYQDMGAKPPKWQNVKMALLLGLSHISIGKIQHSLETADLEIFADPLLEKVCQRLFENAVKHGDHVTLIRVWHTVTPEGAIIFFEDDGVGIPQEKKEQIFSRSEGTSASRGSLIFVREILDITGITITENGEPGKGARFEMTVPNGAYRMNAETNDIQGGGT